MDQIDDISTRDEFPTGHGCCFVGLVLYKGETSVLALISGTWIHNDVNHSVCQLKRTRATFEEDSL